MSSITTTSTLPAPVQQSFSYKLLAVPVPNFIHKIPAMLKQMPRNGGRTLRMRRYNPLSAALVPLGNTGVTPPPQQLSAVDIDAQMDFYGTFVYLNEQVNSKAACFKPPLITGNPKGENLWQPEGSFVNR